MMLGEIRAIRSTKKELRQFAVVMAVACAAAAALLLLRRKDYWYIFLLISVLFITIRFTFPMLLLPVQKAWMALAVVMGWVVSRIILSVLYFAAFTATGLIGRMFGKKFIELEIDKTRGSYWIGREGAARPPESYEKQF
jgi:hypothetical protein